MDNVLNEDLATFGALSLSIPMNEIDETLRSLTPVTKRPYANEQSIEVNSAEDRFTYKWKELQACLDPYIDYEEFYRVDLSLADVRRLVEEALGSGGYRERSAHGEVGIELLPLRRLLGHSKRGRRCGMDSACER
ncbi:MAG: hypothetical protein GYA55_04680 [SAR324 cluster bacterium]|uniref:Uncharacterized protein n=1 Tax=SAR324 cluster bacterium TaxID=2024889 RepID=A0A7X9IJV2_9DELT|nr:hypothetical protein [SAR324 cluster bacterium]